MTGKSNRVDLSVDAKPAAIRSQLVLRAIKFTMKAIVKTADGIRCLEIPAPRIQGRHDVLIRVSRAAICRTDVFAAEGKLPVATGRVLGHEFTGVIEAIGPMVSRVLVGQRVVVNPLLACQRCADCLAGWPHQCRNFEFLGLEMDGAFAELVNVPEFSVFPLPAQVDHATGAYAEPLAATMAVLDADLPQGGRLAVTGTGRIAQLTRFVLETAGHSVSAGTDEHEEYDAVVETDLCSANAETTLRRIKPGGLLVLKSRFPAAVALPPLLLVRRRIRVQSVHYAAFERAMEFLEQHAAHVRNLVGTEWSLEDYEQAFSEACTDDALKIYFKPND